MKKIFKFSIIVFLFIIYLYVCKIDSIPNSIILYGGKNLYFNDFFGITYKIGNDDLNTVLASSKLGEEISKENIVEVKLFDKIKLKDVNLNIINKTKVIPGGQVAGLKLYTSGVMVVGMSEINSEDGKKYKPYENTDIVEGDRIIKMNGVEIENTNHLIDLVNKSNGEKISIEYAKNGEIKNTEIVPAKGKDGKYKIGLWVRDTSAGIGTLSIYEPSTGNFAALGHGIVDIDTGELVEISNGDFITTNVVSIVKGAKGSPGRIQGTIENGNLIGTIYKNTNVGIYGTINNLSNINLNLAQEMEVAAREEITLGKATLLCSLDNSKIEEYEIELEKIFINNNKDNKSMRIKIKDKRLLEKTGGIIQGMSGSPIIQNGKFIGCVTNVLVNDPTRGYAVFGDIMIKEMHK